MNNPKCTPTAIFELLSMKWALLIIKTLIDNSKLRYNEMMSELHGISPKTLTERLRELEGEGIISRKMFPEIPPRVEYSLTEKGMELAISIGYILDWVEKWYPNSLKYPEHNPEKK